MCQTESEKHFVILSKVEGASIYLIGEVFNSAALRSI